MYQISNLTKDAFQEHIIPYDDSNIILSLRFLPTVEMWIANIEYKDKKAYGVKLVLGVTHIKSLNLPFDIVLDDNSLLGLDPFKLDDFEKERVKFYLIENN